MWQFVTPIALENKTKEGELEFYVQNGVNTNRI